MYYFLSLFVITVCLPVAIAVPIADPANVKKGVAPSVVIDSGTIIGLTDSIIDSFNGIPYALQPTGSLRLRPPQPITTSLGMVNAVDIPRSCPQPSLSQFLDFNVIPKDVLTQLQGSPLYQEVLNVGEDCLNLNIQRPAGTTASSKLPVLVYIFGGGFEFGSTQLYAGNSLVTRSVTLGAPILYVAINYRIGGFGFLAGKELQADGSTNLGLRDQRLALQWVQDNIAAFGGDPSKVTIWGESAGAISVFDHTIINKGDNTYKNGKLFRAGIMNSGSIAPADTVSSPKAQNIYNTVVAAAGCSESADTLDCLRQLDYGKFVVASNSVPSIFSYRSVDLSYLPRPDPSDDFFPVSPEVSVNNGQFAKVPVIIGDQEDEATLFSLKQSNITNTKDLVAYLTSFFPSNPDAETIISGLVATYPNDFGISGSPFGTGVLNNIYPQFKRLAAILGDITFTLSLRTYLSKIASQVPTWSYMSSYFYGTPVLGTFHASDLLYAFGFLGPINVPTTSIQQHYISFVNTLDPNKLGTGVPLINWPNWSATSRSLMNFQLLGNRIISDNFREASYQYLSNLPSALRL